MSIDAIERDIMKNPDRFTFCRNELRGKRKVMGLSQAELAERVGKSRSEISLIEHGGGTKRETAEAIADHLQLSARVKSDWFRMLFGETTYKGIVSQVLAPLRNTHTRWHSWVDGVRVATYDIAGQMEGELSGFDRLSLLKIVAGEIRRDYELAGVPNTPDFNHRASVNAKSLTFALAAMLPESASIQSETALKDHGSLFSYDQIASPGWKIFHRAVEARSKGEPFALSLQAIQFAMFAPKQNSHGYEFKLFPPANVIEYMWRKDKYRNSECYLIALMCINAAIIMGNKPLYKVWKAKLDNMREDLNQTAKTSDGGDRGIFAGLGLELINLLEPIMCFAGASGRFVTFPYGGDLLLSGADGLSSSSGGIFAGFQKVVVPGSTEDREIRRLCAAFQLLTFFSTDTGRMRAREVMEELVLERTHDRFAQVMRERPLLATSTLAFVYREARRGKSSDPADFVQVADQFGLSRNALETAVTRLENATSVADIY